MVEGARLEIVYTLIAYRGFKSLALRQINDGMKSEHFFWNVQVLCRRSLCYNLQCFVGFGIYG